jgi:thiol-disulfide isomerase/thioredoxin
MKHIFCILIMVCPYLKGLTQTAREPIRPLTIGDRLPDITLGPVYNYSQQQVKFSQIQAQLTVIDFWATSCGSCVGSFPKLHDIQNKYKGKLRFLMANAEPEDKTKVDQFLARRKLRTGMGFDLLYTLNDSILKLYFPYQTIPHCVWLDKDRKVIAITEGTELTAANIDAVLNNRAPALNYKDDALVAGTSIAPIVIDGKADLPVLQASAITGEQVGRGGTITYERKAKGLVTKFRILNQSLLELYKMANREVFRYDNFRIRIDPAIGDIFEHWEVKNPKKYCYQIESGGITNAEVLRMLRTDLERYFNIEAVIVQEPASCFSVRNSNRKKRVASDGSIATSDTEEDSIRKYLKNEKMGTLCNYLSTILKCPVVDETGDSSRVTIDFPVNFTHLSAEQVINFMETQGFTLDKTVRQLPITLIRSTKSTR